MTQWHIVLGICAVSAVAGCSDQLVTPQDADGERVLCTVGPVTYADLSGGTLDAGRVGAYEQTSGKLDGDRRRGGTVGPITWSTDATGTYVTWSVTGPHSGIAIVLKGGPSANVYRYDAGCEAGERLSSPVNASGRPAQLSNITFYWTPCEC